MKLKKTFNVLIAALFCSNVNSQYTAKVTNGKSYVDLNVKISDDAFSADLGVEISYDVFSEDFTIGFTDTKTKADVIISDSYSADFEVNMKSNFPDINIKASDDVFSEDIAIKIKKSGYVDYLVYNEMDLLCTETLVCALLPIINLHLDKDDRLEGVPIYKARNSQYDTDNNSSKFVEPIITSQIDGEFEGWEGETIFKLTNGQIWQQSSYDYTYHYAYMPEIEIYETKNGFILKVEDVDDTIEVVRIK
jgi:hypothetical protein